MKTNKRLQVISIFVFLFLMLSCQVKMMNSIHEKNITLTKKFYKSYDALQLDSLRVLFAPDAKIYYGSGSPNSFPKVEHLIPIFYNSFPDYTHEIEEIFGAGDKVIVRLSCTGTFKNKIFKYMPNGKKFKYKAIHIFQFSNNKIINYWAVDDVMEMMKQIDIVSFHE